jgi:hypothetical protein
MSATVHRVSQRKYQAWCDLCKDGVNVIRQVDAHIWASTHNREEHSS